jgi:hypothetical protein
MSDLHAVRNGDRIYMTRGTWSASIASGELPDWLKMYRGLRDRSGGKFAQHYTQPVAALEAATREVAHQK